MKTFKPADLRCRIVTRLQEATDGRVTLDSFQASLDIDKKGAEAWSVRIKTGGAVKYTSKEVHFKSTVTAEELDALVVPMFIKDVTAEYITTCVNPTIDLAVAAAAMDGHVQYVRHRKIYGRVITRPYVRSALVVVAESEDELRELVQSAAEDLGVRLAPVPDVYGRML